MNHQIACICGGFYDDFLNIFEGAALTRNDVKKLMFPVLFSQNEVYRYNRPKVPYEKEIARFAQVYPILFSMIEELKRKKHSKLAIILQELESNIFIDTICPRLVDMGIVPLTVHDSILVEALRKGSKGVSECV